MDRLAEICHIVASNLGVPLSEIHPESRASDFPQWDSVHHLLLIMDIEQKLSIKFDLGAIADLDSISKIVDTVDKQAVR